PCSARAPHLHSFPTRRSSDLTTLTWFFLTWFPVYLSQARHMSILQVGVMAAFPALCGFAGGILGGVVSDKLLQAGHSLSFARKTDRKSTRLNSSHDQISYAVF